MLRQLFKDIITKDIIVRYNIRDHKTLFNLATYLLSNIGKYITLNSLKKLFSLGSVTTISSYLKYLEDTYMIFSIPKFDYSYKRQLLNPKKIYGIDVCFAKNNTISFTKDRGRILENVIFLELKRKGFDIFYYNVFDTIL